MGFRLFSGTHIDRGGAVAEPVSAYQLAREDSLRSPCLKLPAPASQLTVIIRRERCVT